MRNGRLHQLLVALLFIGAFLGVTAQPLLAAASSSSDSHPFSLHLPAPESVGTPLYNNGPLITSPGGGPGGTDLSVLQNTSLAMTIFGFGNNGAAGFRMSDGFTIPAGETWNISTVQFFNYQTGSTTTSTMTGVTLQIWDGPPNVGTSAVVFGDTTTNRLASSSWINGYRVAENATTGTTRPIMANVVTVGTSLGAGTYWLDWGTTGSLASGPWSVPITIIGQTNTGDALQFNGTTWAAALDGTFPQGIPFIVEGTLVGNTPTATATTGSTSTPTATATNTPQAPTATATATATPGGGGNRFCSGTPITIPDANPTGATGTITVGSAGTISDLNVIITGTHSWVGDIRLNLSNGTTNVTFYDQPGVPASTFGCSGDNLPGVVADDEGVSGSFENSCQNATPAYTPGGSYTNNNPLSAFDGSATNATWTLTASDLAAGDTGTIDSWCVEFGTGAGPTPTATPTAGQVPDINLNPSSFNETHSSPPQTTTDTLNVQNVGTGTLNWTIAEDDTRPGAIMSAKGDYVFNGTMREFSGFSTSGVAGDTIINTPNVAQGSLFITHSSTQNITALNSVSCNAGGLHTDNSYYRVYDLAGDFGITQTIEVDEVSFGVEQATGATGTQPVTVNLYTLTGVLNTANLTLIGSEAVDVPDSATGTVFAVPVSPEVTVPAGSVLVVELFTPNGQTAGNSFFIGSNADPETDPSYLRAADCGVAQPTATGSIGFPNMHIVMNVSAGIVGGGACSAPTDIPWLTVSPTNGSTSGGGSTPVTLTFNSTSLAQGVYTGTLCVASNDPDEELVTVPITLNVGPPTAIDLSSFTSPVSGVNLGDLAAAGLLLLAGAVLVLRRK